MAGNPLVPTNTATTIAGGGTGGLGLGGGGGGSDPYAGSGIFSVVFPILDQNADDPFGLAGIIPKVGKGNAPLSVSQRVESIAGIPLAKQEALAQVLIEAGVLSPKSSGVYSTTEIQDALTTAFRHAAQAGTGSLSRYLTEQKQQRDQMGLNTAASTGGGIHVIPPEKIAQTVYTAQDIQATADAVAQKLIGRKPTADEIQGILADMNSATATQAQAKGQLDLAAQQQQVAINDATYGTNTATVGPGQPVPNTTGNFANDLLAGLGLPVTPANVNAINAWHQAEGGNAAFNPLNTTQGAAGASNYNSVGVKNYTSYQQGLQATIQTLKNGHYGGILNALKAGDNALAVASAVGASPWGTSGTLMAKVLGGKVQPITGSAPAGAQGQTTDVFQAPVISAVPADPSQTEAATNFFETQRSPEYQAQNLLNVFGMIQSKLASPDPALNPHVLNTPVTMK